MRIMRTETIHNNNIEETETERGKPDNGDLDVPTES